jgi:hypothetical protein
MFKSNVDKEEVISSLQLASLYGEENLFQGKLNEGYNELSFGRGTYIYSGDYGEKITRMWTFYHPNGKIFTHQIPKSKRGIDDFPCRGPAFEIEYSEKEFEEYVKDKKLIISGKESLVEMVSKVA